MKDLTLMSSWAQSASGQTLLALDSGEFGYSKSLNEKSYFTFSQSRTLTPNEGANQSLQGTLRDKAAPRP